MMAVSRVSEKATASKPPKIESSNTTTRAKILLVLNHTIRSYPPRMRRHKLRGFRAPTVSLCAPVVSGRGSGLRPILDRLGVF